MITCREIGRRVTDEWIVKQPLPERTVLWHISIGGLIPLKPESWFKLALGDNEPTTAAEFNAFERIFPGDLDNNIEPGAIWVGENMLGELRCRMPLKTAGRRFAVQAVNQHATLKMYIRIAFTISSIPTEVPDCLLSV